MRTKLIQKLSINVVAIFVISFALNLIWESAHSPLFAGFASFEQHFPICFRATFGDAFYTVILYVGMSAINKKVSWFKQMDIKDIFIVVLTGLLTATAIENNALFIGKWEYTDSMPIVPFFNIGLTPFVQLALLSWLSFYLLKKLIK